MGEYFKKTKIGTCENLYYMRYAELLEHQHEKNDDHVSMSVYLQDDFSYRFPWPDEDNTSFAIANRQPFRNLTFNAPADFSYPHKNRCVSVTCNGVYNVNVQLPCILSPEFKALGLQTSPVTSQPLFFSMQLMAQGAVHTLFRCGYCETGFYCTDPAEIDLIKSAIRSSYIRPTTPQSEIDYYTAIIDRIS